MSSSLNLPSGQVRLLKYDEEVRTDMRLLEVDKHVLDEVLAGRVFIKGSKDDEAVLCTTSKTFLIKYVETTNLQLLVAPEQGPGVDADAEQGAGVTPAKWGTGAGLHTQYRRFKGATSRPAILVAATTGAHLELVEAAPRVRCLEPLLMERPYNGNEAENVTTCMDTDANQGGSMHGQHGGHMDSTDHSKSGGASASGQGLYTFDDLLAKVQASPAELSTALREAGALQLGAHWRMLGAAYMGELLEALLLTAQQEGLPLHRLQQGAICRAMSDDGYDPRVTAHCLSVYGCPVAEQNGQMSAGGATAGVQATAGGPEAMQGVDSDAGQVDGQLWAMSEEKVCLYFLRKALSAGRAWLLPDLLAHWQGAVPQGMMPDPAWLQGEVLMEGSTVNAFSRSRLPKDPEKCFSALFAARLRWDWQDLAPYLKDLQVPGFSVEALLLKYTRASQPAADGPITYTAR